MGFTYHNPDRSTDPGSGRARRPVDPRRRPLVPRRRRAGPAARRRRPASPATPGSTTTPRCAPGCGRWPAGCGPPTSGPSPFADDNSIVDREVAHLRRARLVRQERQPAAARCRQLVRARLRRSPRRRCRRRRAGGRRLRHRAGAASTPARPGRSSPPASSTPTAAWPGCCRRPGPIPVALRPAVGDRLYGCDDCQEACPPTVHLGRRHRRPLDPRRGRLGRRARPAGRRRRDAARPSRALVHRRPRSPLAAPQRARRPRQHGRPATIRGSCATLARYRRRRRRRCSPSTPAGRSELGSGRRVAGRRGRRGRAP